MNFQSKDPSPGPTSAMPATGAPTLRCEGLSKRVGGLAPVEDVSMTVPDKGLFGLCGPNGAGKSTFFNRLAGSVRADAGRVWLREKQITGCSVTERSRLGIGRTWQAVRLVHERTILDNVAVACS